jgi:hypothetical protein
MPHLTFLKSGFLSREQVHAARHINKVRIRADVMRVKGPLSGGDGLYYVRGMGKMQMRGLFQYFAFDWNKERSYSNGME